MGGEGAWSGVDSRGLQLFHCQTSALLPACGFALCAGPRQRGAEELWIILALPLCSRGFAVLHRHFSSLRVDHGQNEQL